MSHAKKYLYLPLTWLLLSSTANTASALTTEHLMSTDALKAVQTTAYLRQSLLFKKPGFNRIDDEHRPVQTKQELAEQSKQLTPEQRKSLKRRQERFDKLPAAEKKKIRKAREHYRELPPERRRELREQWENLSPEQRRARQKELRNKSPDPTGRIPTSRFRPASRA